MSKAPEPKYDLSILIPARNEMFISNTVEDILKHKRGKTEVIVGLDGAWAEPGIPDHPDVRIVYVSKSRGQRGMTNTLARLSEAKYVAKCDAHCAFDEGFDVKLMDAMKGHDNWTVVPIMRNLHAFDWKCMKCGKKTYQGPTPGTPKGITECEDCGNTNYDTFQRKVIWYPKPSPQSRSYLFDSEPHFQYFGEFNKRPEGKGDITPTMSLQGSFFMLTRDKYWELGICDEGFGSWGSQGIEVAVKTWLSGGEVMCVQTTWYAHMFRTQGGDFSFPYPQEQSKVNEAKKTARTLFFDNRWPQQKLPLSWLLEKFWPVPGWNDNDLAKLKEVPLGQSGRPEPSKAMIYTTHNQLQLKVAHKVQNQLLKVSAEKNIPIVSCTMKPLPKMGNNIPFTGPRGWESMFKQMYTALLNSTAEIVYFTEHDVLYHPSHFDFIPPRKDKFYYNINWWRIREGSDVAVHWDAAQVSGLVCYRDLAIEWYKNKIAQNEEHGFDRSYEPGGRNGNDVETFSSALPNVDIRGAWNQTKSKWSPADFRDKSTCINWQEISVSTIPGWENLTL